MFLISAIFTLPVVLINKYLFSDFYAIFIDLLAIIVLYIGFVRIFGLITKREISTALAFMPEIIQKNIKIKPITDFNSKLLFLTHNLNLEGAPKWIYFLTTELKKLGYDITIVSPQDGSLRQMYEEQQIPVLVNPTFFNNKEIDVSFFKKFGLIFLNTIVNSIFVDIIKKENIPVILVIHESEKDTYFSQGNNEEPIKNANSVIFSANATRDVYSNLEMNNNFITIPTSIDLKVIESYKSSNKRLAIRKKHGYSDDDFIVTIVGTIIERKGQLIFTEAAIKLLK